MTSTYHTPITTGAAANAATFNSPLSQLDSAIATLAAVPKTLLIEGLVLSWTSANSITVGTGQCYAENGDLVSVSSPLAKTSLSLSPSTWYHVYVYLSGGVAAAEVVTTAPAASLGTAKKKTGFPAYRYVGSIRTDGSGYIFEFRHHAPAGLMLYSGTTSLIASPHRALSAGTATSATEVSLSAVIPSTSRIGHLRLFNLSDKVVAFGDTSACLGPGLNAGNTAAQNIVAAVPLTPSVGLYYVLASAAGVGGAYIDVYGYYFER